MSKILQRQDDQFGNIVIKLDDIFQESAGSIPASGPKQTIYGEKTARPSVKAKFDRTKRQSTNSLTNLYNTPITKNPKKSILYNRHESTGLTPNQGHFYEIVKPASMRKSPSKILLTTKVKKPDSKKS